MATSDNETFQQLLEEIKMLNKNLEIASSAIKDMTNVLSLAPATVTLDSNSLPQTNSDKSEPSNLDTSAPGSQNISVGDKTLHRTLGYVNWNSSHDILKSHWLIKMCLIRSSLEKLQPLPVDSEHEQNNCNNRAITYGHSTSNHSTTKNYSGLFSFGQGAVVDEEIRFPQDAVYVDVSSPKVKAEIEFMNKLNVQPTIGVIDRFLKIVESEMHTCNSFEKLHGLKWV